MMGEGSGATGRSGGNMKYGDRIYDTLLRRYAIAGEFLPDGDVDVRWEDDGAYGQSKWHRCEPAPLEEKGDVEPIRQP